MRAVPPPSWDDFAQAHNLVIEVHEREHAPKGSDQRFYAHFSRAGVKEGSFYAGKYGDGISPVRAVGAYLALISGETLIVEDPHRREVVIPSGMVWSGILEST